MFWEGGGLEGPLLTGPEWLFFGPFAVPHPTPDSQRKSSLSLFIEMQEPPHPCSSPQAPAGKARGPAELTTLHGSLGTTEVSPTTLRGDRPLQWQLQPLCAQGRGKSPRYPFLHPGTPWWDSPGGDEHAGLGDGQALQVAAVQGAQAGPGAFAAAHAGGAAGGAG